MRTVATGRVARADEISTWRQEGWILVEGLVPTEEIDAAVAELAEMFPTAEQFHADPAGETERWLGHPVAAREIFQWPPTGPGFRPEQHRWSAEFPFPGPALNRLCVHPAVVDFAERALGSTDLRVYQARASAKYTSVTNYEQPMHVDRNHSWLPPKSQPPWWHMETFLYLSDVDVGNAPTHLVSVGDSAGREPTALLIMPRQDPDVYAKERPALGIRGSVLAYRPDVFHRAVDLTDPAGARFLLNTSFKIAGNDWIGYDSAQSRSTEAEWTAFVEGSTPRELALFGFPPPGHPIWDATLVAQTAVRYPKLDLTPWSDAL